MQCKYVLLGVSHDSGYVPFLQEFASDKSLWERITLLEGDYTHTTIERLGFVRRLKIGTLFVSSSTPSTHPINSNQRPAPQSTSIEPRTTELMPTQQRPQQNTNPSPPRGPPYRLSAVELSRLRPVLKDDQGRRFDKPLHIDTGILKVYNKRLCPQLYLKGYCQGCGKDHSWPWALATHDYDNLWLSTRRDPCPMANCCDPACVLGHNPKPAFGTLEYLKYQFGISGQK